MAQQEKNQGQNQKKDQAGKKGDQKQSDNKKSGGQSKK